MAKYTIQEGSEKSVHLSKEMHTVLLLYAHERGLTVRAAVRKLLQYAILADKEFSGEFRKAVKKARVARNL